MYSNDGDDGEMNPYPFSVRHFVVFRLCPSDACSSCDNTAHGQYLMEADDYLQATVQEQAKQFQYMCENCEEECDEDGANCSGCGRLCYLSNNLEANGYVDAVNYLECQALPMANNDDDAAAQGEGDSNDEEGDSNEEEGEINNDDAVDDQSQLDLYIGPRCSNNGGTIQIGLFYDQYCLAPYSERTPEEMLGYNISYIFLSHTYTAGGSNCLSCKEVNQDANANVDGENVDDAIQDVDDDLQDVDDVNEMCETVYEKSAKCESIYGIDGFVQMNRKRDGTYENQVENEFMVCEYIESLMLDSYTEAGEINLQGEQLIIYRGVTSLQMMSFWLLTLAIVSLLVAAFFIQRKIENSCPKLDLSCQGDAHIA